MFLMVDEHECRQKANTVVFLNHQIYLMYQCYCNVKNNRLERKLLCITLSKLCGLIEGDGCTMIVLEI